MSQHTPEIESHWVGWHQVIPSGMKEEWGHPSPNHVDSQWGGVAPPREIEENSRDAAPRFYTRPVLQYPAHVCQLCNASSAALDAQSQYHVPRRRPLCCLIKIFTFSFVKASSEQQDYRPTESTDVTTLVVSVETSLKRFLPPALWSAET